MKVTKAQEQEALQYFLGLKKNYELARQPLEDKWRQARSAYLNDDNLNKVYEGRANIKVPVMQNKIDGISARIARVIFNVDPIGRIEKSSAKEQVESSVVDLWNKFIFEYQLPCIDFKEHFKMFIKDKCILGTSIAKITQEYEEGEINFSEDERDAEFIKVKDDTYFRPILLEEFYSDISKIDINDSQACIHSTTITYDELKVKERKKRKFIEQSIDPQTQEVIAEDEVWEEDGIYSNLNLLTQIKGGLTEEQDEYLSYLGYSKAAKRQIQTNLKNSNEQGVVRIDECYGKFSLDGVNFEEVVCTIAEGFAVIRLEKTPFVHKRFKRPFIVGRYIPIPHSLYGLSKVIIGLNLLEELNAARAQATDARTRSAANMWYQDTSKNVKWDKTWRPNGIVKGDGQNGLVPLLTPYVGNVSIEDAMLIARDLDMLFSLSPIQEGTSDNRLIPQTATQTRALIAQNDMPINDIIDNTIEWELKPFVEMLFERNMKFKTPEDLLIVWDEKDLQKAKIDSGASMKDLFFNTKIKILGNMELSNEVAHQTGYVQFLQIAQQIPFLAKRIDFKVVGQKLLKSFGIKDDAEGIWFDEEIIQQLEQEQAQAQQQQMQAQQQMIAQQATLDVNMYNAKSNIDAQAQIAINNAKVTGDAQKGIVLQKQKAIDDIQNMSIEAALEGRTGQKVQ